MDICFHFSWTNGVEFLGHMVGVCLTSDKNVLLSYEVLDSFLATLAWQRLVNAKTLAPGHLFRSLRDLPALLLTSLLSLGD